jgi:7-cyano-7-deazaguanine synthase
MHARVTPRRPCVLLLSGGLDSTTVFAMAKKDGFDVHCLAFDYGQRHKAEQQSARVVATAMGACDFQVVHIDLRAFGGSALTDDVAVPKGRAMDAIGAGIPVTYVPARNTIFLSFALAKAEVIFAHDIFIGVNAADYSGYPDCRPAFVDAFQHLANVATRIGTEDKEPLRIHAPLMHMTKGEIIQAGMALGVDYALTHSCYDPIDDKACGGCDACQLRRQGFADAGVSDPTRYA